MAYLDRKKEPNTYAAPDSSRSPRPAPRVDARFDPYVAAKLSSGNLKEIKAIRDRLKAVMASYTISQENILAAETKIRDMGQARQLLTDAYGEDEA